MPYRTDSRIAGRHPFEIFIMVLTLLVTVPIVLGATPQPTSIAASVPPPYGYLWAITLAVGAALTLGAVVMKNRATGLIVEQLGLALVGLACLIYGIAIAVVRGVDAANSIAIVIGFGMACLWRYYQIQRVINTVKVEQTKREVAREVKG